MKERFANLRLFILIAIALSVFFALFLLFSGTASAANCWQYSSNATCAADSGCKWKNDSWGNWCEEMSCWSLYSQSECITNSIAGKNCTWQAGGTSYWCETKSCWSYSGTNASACTGNSAGLSCEWSNYCYNSGSTSTTCWQYTNQSACLNSTGCSWGSCYEKGCGSYATNTSCNAAKDWNGKNCTWEGSYCTENGCYKYNTNESTCESNSAGLNCEWKWNSCQDVYCYKWDFTNASACINNTANLTCTWTGSYCNKEDCWAYTTEAGCSAQQKCNWKAYTSSGWCQQVDCWTWDSYNGGNQTQCENNAYSLSCLWSGNPPGNATGGWCYRSMAATSCSNKTTERECLDTYYCWWEFNNLNNASAGGNCKEPGNFSGVNINTSILNEWNPKCYIFDMNATDCNNTLGCNYSSGACLELNNSYGSNITLSGINCSYINNSQLCNNIPVLSSCCSWQNNSCTTNKLSTSCWSQLKQKSEDSCEDAKTSARCSELANSPWYMPCAWNNATEKCDFKTASIFGNGSQSLVKINNKKNCEAAGGKWITENYCEGNVSVPTGRCEYKFNDEDNCDKACFACEYRDSSGNPVNSTNAANACKGSKLGICEFDADTRAPNGIGYCKAKEQFKKGLAGDCNLNCGDCNYKGNPSDNDTAKKPSYYCITSKANSDGGGCKWIADNSTATGGYCVKKGDKTCLDACDRCKTQNECQNTGRTGVANKTGSCKWQGDSNTGSCVNNIGESAEICWDGIDNTNDGLIDCSDSSCYADSYCGLVSGDCFGWTDNTTCIQKNCEWVTDSWGSWCDFKGSQCWKYDANQSYCNNRTNCQWNSGTGAGWCEQDWTKSNTCSALSYATCTTTAGCNWTSDTWCAGTGNSTDWCRNFGGWCDYTSFQTQNCWDAYTSSTCNSLTGCTWMTDQFSTPKCEVNSSANCGTYTSNATCISSGCFWRNDTWGGWCSDIANKCWGSIQPESSCNAQTQNGVNVCYWDTWMNSCRPLCYNSSTTTSSGCNAIPGCAWKDENGWCAKTGMSSCTATNTTNYNNQTSCESTTGCRWKTPGWCDPKGGGFSSALTATGGGMGGAMAGNCYKYDGNQTLCSNKTIINISCAWMPNPSATCDVDWSRDCWQYGSIAGGCNETNGCWWSGTSCMNVMDQCWSNQSLQGNANNCRANQYCTNNSWGGCEPKCFSQATQSTCIAGNLSGKCRWTTGWCNPLGMGEMFDKMEAGAPMPLGFDGVDAGMQPSVDIIGFGMKDSGNSFGLGANVNDFSNASICNKEKLSSNVMGMVGGAYGMIGSERVGAGNDTVIFVVYLDTDGNSTTGGCALSHNSSALGYEFRFKYSSQWNASTSKAAETFNSYKCDDAEWKASDIKLSAWKKNMCSEIGGPMIAVEKSELARFPILYDSAKDMRVYVVTIGNTGNISYPTDSAGPGWTTPGAIDFEIENAFGYGADTAKFEDILKKGFVQYEDCFNNVDDDGDNLVDCNDWNCQYAAKCEGTGVNAASYTDTRSPKVIGARVEEYPDAAIVMYDTDKPANGSLELYGADSRCLNITGSVNDIGVLKNNTIRQYKLWHTAMLYDDGDANSNISLNYPLASGVTYYYKLRVCDSAAKCAVSRCSNFTTPASTASCSYCDFVTRIKVPSGWNIYYDTDRNGVYEHWQGGVCGPNAGMKTNYTIGRKVNIKMNKSDGATYFEFINATLSKTGLNDKVRTISSAGDIIFDSSKGIVGLPSETRDKIINNLHPEACRVKVPIASGGNCTELFHCDDNGNNCVNRTAAAGGAPLDVAECLWNVPFCEFSTYKTSAGSGGSGGTSSGGGGGGGEETKKAKTYELSTQQIENGFTGEIAVTDRFKFPIGTEVHYATLAGLTSTLAVIQVLSKTQEASLTVGQEARFELTGDDYYDLSVKLDSIRILVKKASLTLKKIHEQVPEEAQPAGEASAEEEEEAQPAGEAAPASPLLGKVLAVMVVSLVVLVAAISILYNTYRKKRYYKKGY